MSGLKLALKSEGMGVPLEWTKSDDSEHPLVVRKGPQLRLYDVIYIN